MSIPIIPAVIIGGVAYVAVTQGFVPGPGPTRNTSPSGGVTVGQAIDSRPSIPATTGQVRIASRLQSMRAPGALGADNLGIASAYPSDARVDLELQSKLDAIEAAAKKAYDDADDVARSKAAETLNGELKLNPKLTGNEDWKTISAVVGGATGAAAGVALCGPVCGKVGALCGAYLGAKIHELVAKYGDDLKAWLDDKWSNALNTHTTEELIVIRDAELASYLSNPF